MPLPILIYHQIAARYGGMHDCAGTPEDWPYRLDQDVFAEQLQWIYGERMQTMVIEDLTVESAGPATASGSQYSYPLCLTFDDGTLSHYTKAFPMLLTYGQRATFFVITDKVDQEGYVSWTQLREMAAHGMSIQSHSCSHASLTHVASYQARDELRRSKEQLEQKLGQPVAAFAVPGGSWRPSLTTLAEDCGYQLICTSEQGLNHAPFELLHLKRLSIRRTYSAHRVQSLMRGQRSALLKQQFEALCLASAKTVLGWNRYNAVRRHLLARASRGETSHSP